MSGGIAFRNLARFAPPSSAASCHVSSRPPASSSLGVSTLLPTRSQIDSRNMALEDWEVLVDEERPDRHRRSDRLVFGPVPTEEEVEVATRDLQAALNLDPVSNVDTSHSGSASVMFENPSGHTKDLDEARSIKGTPLPVVKSQPLCLNHEIIFAGRSSAVYQAFSMLQNNPEVQGVVKSLACDPAVWKAILNNEKVQEFNQYLQEKKETSNFPKLNAANYEGGTNLDSGLKIFSIMFDHMRGLLLQIMNKIVLIVSSMFDNALSGKKSSDDVGHIDQVVASCMMLTVAVLILVLVNRAVLV